MRVLVTGGAGFIGSQLAGRLINEGHHVVVIDNLSTGLRENVPSQAEFVEYDLVRPDCLEHIPAGKYDAVCHLAAQTSGPASADMPYYDLQANAASTLLLSRWCVEHKVPRFLYASSMVVYGNALQSPVNERAVPEPISYYGVSKLASEHLLRLAAQDGLNVTSFRMFSVYGPGQNLGNLKQGMVSIFLAYMLRGVEVPVTGSLQRFRDFVYVDDVVDAWVRALNLPGTNSAVYNLGTGYATTVEQLLSSLKQVLGLPSDYPVRELPGSSSDQFGMFADASAAQADLGWVARTELAVGLQRMADWARRQS